MIFILEDDEASNNNYQFHVILRILIIYFPFLLCDSVVQSQTNCSSKTNWNYSASSKRQGQCNFGESQCNPSGINILTCILLSLVQPRILTLLVTPRIMKHKLPTQLNCPTYSFFIDLLFSTCCIQAVGSDDGEDNWSDT